MRLLTAPALDHPVDLLLCVHRSQVECFDDRSALKELRGVIWRRSKLLEHFSPHARGSLLLTHHGAISKVAFYEEHHLLVSHKDVIGADYI